MSHLLVISAGMGTPSSSRMLGDRLAEATVKAMTAGGTPTPEVKVLELRDLAVDLATYYSSHVPTKTLQAAFDLVGTASGVIAVSPVLNAGVSGLIKLFFDLLDEGVLKGRPVLMAATGGTARHSLAIDQTMLPMFFYLKAAVAPTGVFAATDDWGTSAAEGGRHDQSGLMRRVQRAGTEFAELIERNPAVDYADEFANVPDFASLWGG